MIVALGILLMVLAVLVGLLCITCALAWLLPSQISKIILPARTGYGTIDRHREKKHETLKMVFCFVSFIGWYLIYNSAFNRVLSLIPDEWFYQNGYDSWLSFEAGISGFLSFWISLWTLVQLEKLNASYLLHNRQMQEH